MQNSHDFCSSSSGNNASASNVGINGDREFPVGYRFCPTDYELIVFYLMNKISNLPLPHDKIPSLNLYDYCPSDLTESCDAIEDGEWYFFTPRERKYPNGSRPNRAADSGYWKATGRDKNIVAEKKKKTIGLKKTLVFYEGKPPKGTKTNWIMHEYRVNSTDAPQHVRQDASDMKLDDWVLCRIHNKDKEELVDDKADDQKIAMKNDQQSATNNDQQIMMNYSPQIMMNNDQQILMNNNPPITMNNDQQTVRNDETGYSLAQLAQYVDYNNPMSLNYMMHHLEPRYEINPSEVNGLNDGGFSDNQYLMMLLNNQIHSDEMIPQNATYLATNHHQQH